MKFMNQVCAMTSVPMWVRVHGPCVGVSHSLADGEQEGPCNSLTCLPATRPSLF